jgi:hypothetical protein
MGSQWQGMGRDLMRIECFRETILECSEAVRLLGVDPYDIMMNGDETAWKNTMNCMVCIAAVQVGVYMR